MFEGEPRMDAVPAARLRAGLRGLPVKERELLSLRFDADLTYVEIAQILSMSKAEVAAAVIRALRRLKESLDWCEV